MAAEGPPRLWQPLTPSVANSLPPLLPVFPAYLSEPWPSIAFPPTLLTLIFSSFLVNQHLLQLVCDITCQAL